MEPLTLARGGVPASLIPGEKELGPHLGPRGRPSWSRLVFPDCARSFLWSTPPVHGAGGAHLPAVSTVDGRARPPTPAGALWNATRAALVDSAAGGWRLSGRPWRWPRGPIRRLQSLPGPACLPLIPPTTTGRLPVAIDIPHGIAHRTRREPTGMQAQ
jgi:hypothetical protein